MWIMKKEKYNVYNFKLMFIEFMDNIFKKQIIYIYYKT